MKSTVVIKKDIDKMLYAMLGKQYLVDQWWDSKNHAFDEKTPYETYLTGEEGRNKVYEYVSRHFNG